MAATPEPKDPAADEKSGADDKQLEIVEQNAKLAEKLEAAAQRVAAIAETVAEQRSAQPPAPAAQPQQPARLSEEQLMALVESKQITMAQAMAYQRKLAIEDAQVAARQVTQQALAEVGSRATEHQIASAIAQYRQAVPSLGQKHSAEWTEVAQRFSQLVAEGYPNTIATELQALRELYGREPGKQSAPREHTKERATRGAETPSPASARTPAPRRGRSSSEPDPDLPSDHKTYVEHMIRIGQYRGWDDPRVAKYVERHKTLAARKARGA